MELNKYYSLFSQIRIIGTYENPLFCAKDICDILGYIKNRKAIESNVDERDKINYIDIKDNQSLDLNFINNPENMGIEQEPPPGALQIHPQTIFINESGLYSLMLSSKLPIAKDFKYWITSEVIPFIRQKGKYEIENKYLQLIQEKDEILCIRYEEEQKFIKEKDKLKEELENKDKELEIKNKEEKILKEKLEKKEKYNLHLSDVIRTIIPREKNQVIYIASSNQYELRNRYKVGGVKNFNSLKSRLSTL